MPQIGWLEILVVVIMAILIVGPKDFPIMVRKIGSWIGSIKSYFSNIQNDFSEIESDIEKDFSLDDKNLNIKKDKEKNE